MITDCKVTEIFWITDEFCKVFDAHMAKYTFIAERKHKYHLESRVIKAGKNVISRCEKKKMFLLFMFTAVRIKFQTHSLNN